jgi:ring-1,2-phenylacetyl-CoA epoxidase subunit PaaD
MLTRDQILSWLEEVKDPEIPVLSLVDLGVITKVEITGENSVFVEMTPTFSGCPAMEVMKSEVKKVLDHHNLQSEIKISFETPWSSNRISEKGKTALKKFGLAPPPAHNLVFDIDILEHVPCPYCGSENTVLKSPFGPTLCRSLHYCDNCRQAFEQFKPL